MATYAVSPLRSATVDALFAADQATQADAVRGGKPAAQVAAFLRGCGHGHTGGRKAAALAALDALAAEEATGSGEGVTTLGDVAAGPFVSGATSTVGVCRAYPDASQDVPDGLRSVAGAQSFTGGQ